MGKFSHEGELSRLRMPYQVCFYPLNGFNIVFQQPVNSTSLLTLSMAMYRLPQNYRTRSFAQRDPYMSSIALALPGEQYCTQPKSKLEHLPCGH